MNSADNKDFHEQPEHKSNPVNPFPAFKDLPLRSEYPPHAAWGVWGEQDELGTVNNITPETITAASKEIKLGLSIPLNWSADQPKYSFYNRKGFHQEIIHKTPHIVNDDVIQCCIYDQTSQSTPSALLSDWAKTGIVGRGVLLDFYAYAQRHKLEYDPYTPYGVTVQQLKAVQAEQGIEFRKGDILLIRFGFISLYNDFSDERKRKAAETPHTWAGVEQSTDVLEWIWNTRFSAVGGDVPAFEKTGTPSDLQLHPVILSGFGCPVGELFDLERLAAECESAKRWSFFFTSAPLNIPGGVASPPNAIAIL